MWSEFIIVSVVFTADTFGQAANGVITSKACYGKQEHNCTRHSLHCNTGVIEIQDAFLTIRNECLFAGLSGCDGINLTNIPTTGSRHNYTVTRLRTLYRDCSNRSKCSFNGGREVQLTINFSIVKYACYQGTNESVDKATTTTATTTTTTAKTTTTTTTTTITTERLSVITDVPSISGNHKEPNGNLNLTLAAAGSCVGTILVIVVVIVLSLWFKRKRRLEFKFEQKKSVISSDVTDGEKEYSTIDEERILSLKGATPSCEISASVAGAVRNLQTKSSSIGENDYDYNHLGHNFNAKLTGSDYDTAASASRAVAQMVRDKDTAEDDYDHFHKTEIKSSDSPYDTTDQCMNETHYSLAGTVDNKDP